MTTTRNKRHFLAFWGCYCKIHPLSLRGCATRRHPSSPFGLCRTRRRSEVDRAGEPDYKPALPPLAPGSAQVAQLVEHATENRSVGGSIPPLGTIGLSGPVLFFLVRTRSLFGKNPRKIK